MKMNNLKEKFNKNKAWGLLTSIDLFNCHPGIMRDKKAIEKFTKELCQLIKMKRFKETQIVYFGKDERVAGYSMTQLIETSLISGHFANQSNSVYIDIFSCKYYDPFKAGEFTKKFFKAEKMKINSILRGKGISK